MSFRDLVVIAAGNLRRMKLRTALTTAGVVIAITTFVAMLSFGAGNQESFEQEFYSLGLLTTMTVSQPRASGSSDTATQVPLDLAAIDRIAAVPGVDLVYPYESFTVQVDVGDTVIASKAQALPLAALRTRFFSRMAAGTVFDSSDARQAIISLQFARDAGFTNPDSAIGTTLIVSTRVSTIDSALAHVLLDGGESILSRAKRISLDSLRRASYRSRVIRTEANAALRRFVNGFLNAQEIICDTLTIVGVREMVRSGPIRVDPLIIPLSTARRFSGRGFTGGPSELFAAMSAGTLFGGTAEQGARTFPQLTVHFDPRVPYNSVRDSIQAMGFSVFSFAEQFEQIQRIFIYFDIGLGIVGLIALLTASFGIINTMVMSITERRREIGILKSLGADQSDIRLLFLVESGVIGTLGTGTGIFAGWLITRIITAIAQGYMRSQGMPEVDLFAFPVWLLGIAIAIGVGVSVLAGSYPATRAGRVDPVEALRGE